MREVTRYNAIGDCAVSEYGDFVEFDDYDIMRARAEAAEAECQRLSDGLTTIASYKLRDFAGPHGMAINCVHVARETLAARTKEAAP